MPLLVIFIPLSMFDIKIIFDTNFDKLTFFHVYIQNTYLGRELRTGPDRAVHPGRGQALPLCELPDHQRQAGPDQTLEAQRCRLCP